jgi:hypothetical protein
MAALTLALLTGAGIAHGLKIDTIGPAHLYKSFVSAANSLPETLDQDCLFYAEDGIYDSGEVSLEYYNPNAYTVTFRPLPGASVTVGPGALPFAQTFYVYGAYRYSSHVVLENLTIKGGWEDAVLFENADSCVVRACVITADSTEDSSTCVRATATSSFLLIDSTCCTQSRAAGFAAIALTGNQARANYSRIRRCTITSSGTYGIYVSGSPNFSIDSTAVSGSNPDSTGIGIFLRARSRDSRILGCTVDAARACGIQVANCLRVTIDGTTVNQTLAVAAPYAFGILVTKHSDTTAVRRCAVSASNLLGTASHGIYVDNSMAVVIDSCRVSQLTPGSTWGIRIYWNSQSSVVNACSVATVGYTGIYVDSSDYTKVDNSVVDGAPYAGGGMTFDIFFRASSACRLFNNRLRGMGTYYGIVLHAGCSNDSVLDNRILTTNYCGLGVEQGSNHVVANNFISGWGLYGVLLDAHQGTRLYYNSIYGRADRQTSACLRLDSTTGIGLKDNIIWNQGQPNPGVTMPFCCILANSSSLEFSDYNDLLSTGGIVNRPGLDSFMTLAAWQGFAPLNPDTHSISADPRFVSAGTGDLHLLDDSPCIGSGVAVPEITDDIDRDLRGTPPDIGADEYVPVGVSERLPRFGGAMRVSPNPSRGAMLIDYSISAPGKVSLKLYDASGYLVRTLASGYHPAGSYSLQLAARGTRQRLAAGVYVLRLDGEGRETVRKLIIE